MLQKQFENYIIKNQLFTEKDKLLLALSGGCDSVALFHLLKNSGYKFNAAHCNFNLRKNDSDADEQFVTELCEKFDIQLFKTSFNTKEFAENNKISLEDAARKLRYVWFEEIRTLHNFSLIIVAHHLDDKIETFFINLTKGTGIKGLRSIQAKNNKLVRPLLFAKKEDIETYCTDNNIQFRTDLSNFDTHFLRNKFRHEVLPVFSEINPKFKDSMAKNFQIFKEFEAIYNDFINNQKQNVISEHGNLIYINTERLLSTSAPLSLLFEIIRLYGFKSSQNKHIFNNINNLQTGKLFFSKTHRILKTKDFLIIDSLKSEINNTVSIFENTTQITNPIILSFKLTDIIPENLKTEYNTAYIDTEKITFPLQLRKAENADYFCPFGMNGRRLLSDFFTDKKINLFERENIWLLTNNDNEIIWIIGYRTDNRFRITEKTKKILIISVCL